MSFRLKAGFILVTLGLSAIALAGEPGNNIVVPSGITVLAPDSEGVWSFGAEALYMQQGSNFQYASTGFETLEQHNLTAGNQWDWGGEADVSYLFPGSRRDVRLAYTYLNFNSKDSVSSPGNVTPFAYDFPADVNSGEGHDKETLNQVDLVFGQWMNVGNRVDLHPFMGLRYANLRAKNTDTFNGLGATPPASTGLYETDDNTSNFQGVGPRAGFDTNVNLGYGFSIVGTFAGALVVGNLDSKMSYNYYAPATSAFSGGFDYPNDSSTLVVPELDADLGLNYAYAINEKTSMDVSVGYQVVNYFNAEELNFSDATYPNSVNTLTDFSYQGVYLRLQVNVA
ncbi:MAG: hypothetical protein HKM04_03795 [Legionellales bacterium]|nr:hypothetical protein [Legionellales bacterium]